MFDLRVRVGGLQFRVRLDRLVSLPRERDETEAGLMPHLQPLDGVELDEDVDEDVLGFQ